MPRPGGFQPMKRGQRKLSPGPQTQAMSRGRAAGQGKVLAQALKNGIQSKDKRQSVGPTAHVGMPKKKAPQSGALKQLLSQKDQQMRRKRKSLIPPQSRL